MKLLDFCEPIFEEIFRINSDALDVEVVPGRVANPKPSLAFDALQETFEQAIKGRDQQAKVRPDVRGDYQDVRSALIFFIDEFVTEKESKLPCKNEWLSRPLAAALIKGGGTIASGEEFFKLLDLELEKDDESARERLAIYYVCLGLGFKGKYFNNPGELDNQMEKLQAKLRGWVHPGVAVNLFSGAHEPDLTPLYRKPSRWIKYAVAAAVVICLSLLAGYSTIYHEQYKELKGILERIQAPGPRTG